MPSDSGLLWFLVTFQQVTLPSLIHCDAFAFVDDSFQESAPYTCYCISAVLPSDQDIATDWELRLLETTLSDSTSFQFTHLPHSAVSYI